MKKILLLLTSATLLVLPILVYAQTSAYRPLIQLPVTTGGATGWQGYIDLLYATAISLAALLAVIKIVIAGAKLMFSDVVPTKSAAKEEIQGALFGLLLILGAVILLNLINPQLTNTTINIDRIQPTPTVPPAPGVVAARPASPAPGAPSGGRSATSSAPSGGNPAPSAPIAPVARSYSPCVAIVTSTTGQVFDPSRCPGGDLSTERALFSSSCRASGGTPSTGYESKPYAVLCRAR